MIIGKENVHFSFIMQGSPTNGSFEWINPTKFRNLFITFMTVLFKLNQEHAIINNVDTANVARNNNDEEVTILPGFYSIGEIIAILNTMTNTTFPISTMATNNGCIYIQSQYSIDFTNAPDMWEIFGLGNQKIVLSASFYGSNVIDITRNRQVIQVYSSLVPRAFLRSEDAHGQPEQQSAHHDDHWRSHDQLLSICKGHLHSDDNPIRSIDVCVQGLDRQHHTPERRIQAPVDDWIPGWMWMLRHADLHIDQSVQHDWSVG